MNFAFGAVHNSFSALQAAIFEVEQPYDIITK